LPTHSIHWPAALPQRVAGGAEVLTLSGAGGGAAAVRVSFARTLFRRLIYIQSRFLPLVFQDDFFIANFDTPCNRPSTRHFLSAQTTAKVWPDFPSALIIFPPTEVHGFETTGTGGGGCGFSSFGMSLFRSRLKRFFAMDVGKWEERGLARRRNGREGPAV